MDSIQDHPDNLDNDAPAMIIENDLTPSSHESEKEVIRSTNSEEEKSSSIEKYEGEEEEKFEENAMDLVKKEENLIFPPGRSNKKVEVNHSYESDNQENKKQMIIEFPEAKPMPSESQETKENVTAIESHESNQIEKPETLVNKEDLAQKIEKIFEEPNGKTEDGMRTPEEYGQAFINTLLHPENQSLPDENEKNTSFHDLESHSTAGLHPPLIKKENFQIIHDSLNPLFGLELAKKKSSIESIDLHTERQRILSKGFSSPLSRVTIQIEEKSRSSSFQESYNPLKFPGDLIIAEKHAQAAKLGKIIPDESELCPCCRNHVKKELIGFCCRDSELRNLGPAFPLLLKLIKLCVILFCIPFFILVAIPHFVFISDECGRASVTGVYTCNVDEEFKYDVIMNVLTRRLIFDIIFSFYFMIAALGIKIYLLRYRRKLTRRGTIADFSILVKKLPKDIKIAREYCQGFNKEENLLPVVKEINFIYDFEEIYDLKEELRELVEEKRKLLGLKDFILLPEGQQKSNTSNVEDLMNKYFMSILSNRNRGKSIQRKHKKSEISNKSIPEPINLVDEKVINSINDSGEEGENTHTKTEGQEDKCSNKKSKLQIYLSKSSISERLKEIDQELEHIFKELEKAEKRLKSEEELNSLFLGQCFVTFNNKEVPKELVEDYNILKCWRRKNRRKILDKHVDIIQAPEPADILWENLGYPLNKKLMIRAGLLAIEVSILAGFYGIIYAIHKKIHGEDLFTSFWKSLMVILCNQVLEIILYKFIFKEKHKTKSAADRIIVRFMIPIMIYNIVMFELFPYIEVIFNEGCPEFEEHEQQYGEIIKKMYFVMLMQAIVESLFKLLDFKYLKKLYQRRQIRKNSQKILYNQEEMNEIFEGPELELRSYYADVIMVLLVGSFSWPFCPIVVFFTILALFCFYWILKLSLLRRCVVQKHQCDNLIPTALKFIMIGPILYVLMIYLMNGTTVYCSDYGVNDSEIQALNIILIGELSLFVFVKFMPLDWIINWRLEDLNEPFEKVVKNSSDGYNHVERILKA